MFLAYRLGGESKWSLIDKVCAGIGVLAILAGLAAAFARLEVAHHITIGGCCIAYFVGVFPTILSAWKDPKTEPLLAWLMWLIGSFFYLSTELGKGEVGSIAIMITIILEEVVVLAVLVYRTFMLKVRHVPLFAT